MFINVPKAEDMQSGFDLIEDGVVEATVTKLTDRISQAGNPMTNVEFTVTSEPYTKRKLFLCLVFTETALWRVDTFVQAITGNHLPEGQISVEDLQKMIAEACLGAKVHIRVGHAKIKAGAKKGEDTNTVEEVVSA